MGIDGRTQKQNTPLKFFCLLRESSDPQERKKGLTRQWRQVNRFCSSGGHTIAHYAQIIESASRGCRLEWQQAVEQAIELHHGGEIEAILFPEIDRETRNPTISIPILNLALANGVPVFFAEEKLQLDPQDPDATQTYTDGMARACAYLATMVRKCREGRFDRANEDGKLPSNTKMFGFNIVDGRRVPNQAQAEALREAAKIALKDRSWAPAVQWINDRGFRTTVGKPFKTVTLRGLFRNRALIGETVVNFKEKTVPLHHEPILDVATFEALQAMLDERSLRAQRSRSTFYALSGLPFCGCGEKFEPTKAGRNRFYYRCSKHCGEKAWKKDELEVEIFNSFTRYLEQRENQLRSLQLAQQSSEKLERDRQTAEREIEANLGDWRTLLQKELANYPDIIIDEEKQRLTAERESLLRCKARIDAELGALSHIDPVEVEVALTELAKPLHMANAGGYSVPSAMSWERESTKSLTAEQAHVLRETLLKLNCRITIRNGLVFLSGRLTLRDVRVKQEAS